MATIIGNADKKLSPYLKAWIKPEGQDVLICAAIGQGTSRQLQANWNSPFEQSSIGSVFEKTAGLVQLKTGRTALTTLNSEQIWEGNRPTTFNLVLQFYALADAFNEVMRPLAALEAMASPQVNAGIPLDIEKAAGNILNAVTGESQGFDVGDATGRLPPALTLNIGRNAVMTNCRIESMDTPLDKERDRNGHLIRAEVSLQIATKAMLNASDIPASWGIGSKTLF